MEITPKAQAVELIRASQKILVLSHKNPDGDALGSALAMKLALEKMKKSVEVAIAGNKPKNCAFLPGYESIVSTVEASNDLVITIDTRQTGENLKLGHKKLPDTHQVVVVISPERGSLVPEDVTVARSRPKYDLIIILDCSGLDRIGSLVEEMPDLFFETPTVSIDHHSTNGYFAKVNWVDMTATSTAEMLVSLFEAMSRDESLLDEDIATALLTGLTTDTGSFQNSSTTPKSLTVAAQLVAAGARQQEIIDHIFRTKPLSTLKLWGKVLSNIREESDGNFVWAPITAEEIKSVGAETSETGGLIDELLKTAQGFNFALLLSERDGQVHGSFRSVKNNFVVSDMAQMLGGGGHPKAAAFEVSGSLRDRQSEIIASIKEHLRRQSQSTS